MFTLHTAHVQKWTHLFFIFLTLIFSKYGDETFWSWSWIPKDGECFFLYDVFITVDFHVIKKGLARWGNCIYFSLQSLLPPPNVLKKNLDDESLPLSFPASHVCLWCGCTCPSAVDSAPVTAFLFHSPRSHPQCGGRSRAAVLLFIFRVFRRTPSCSKTLNESRKQSKLRNFKPGWLAKDVHRSLVARLAATSVLSLFDRSSYCWRRKKQMCTVYGFNHEFQTQNVHFVET